MTTPSVLLILSGGIAAYKSLELIRRLRDASVEVTCILTKAAEEFVTPLSVSALSGNRVYRDLFSLTDEAEMGHIQLSRQADLVVVAPATADLMARHAQGMANDLATTALLATTAPVMMAPAMNVQMWLHPATQQNVGLLKTRGVEILEPDEGPMACGEFGPGRMIEPDTICSAVLDRLASLQGDEHPEPVKLSSGSLKGLRALVTSGPTHEPIDPVRYIANRSSGKQGHAIAAALRALGAETTLVSGPTDLPAPAGVKLVCVETAREMLAACRETMGEGPGILDIAVCAAAVSDWSVKEQSNQKRKKKPGETAPTLELAENPDILADIAKPGISRPALVVGFAAETENHLDNAKQKKIRKGCDWILLNDVGTGTGTFGGDVNQVHVLTDQDVTLWPSESKEKIARKLAELIAWHFRNTDTTGAKP
ncbi:bifunctional phosphopantothenoylcysteine decarboxylase/phosphopantothenate--cysteine ligase CoaBC [Kiloniella sp. b19]|uniref:bifunctional phosphopantothenoylcysteine decarboxylase/phosphopantothenate--cysteine ligase CoaBC n=1 Tax=Kiloniella sp. GXU_MW_B19 TaxID=3141326 RepID=UPI0031E35EC4